MFGQYGSKPRSKRLLRCRKGESSGKPAPPGIQFSTHILDATALDWLIHEIVQCPKKSIKSYNQVPVLWREKACSKVESSSVGCQKALIRSVRNSKQLPRRENYFASCICLFYGLNVLLAGCYHFHTESCSSFPTQPVHFVFRCAVN